MANTPSREPLHAWWYGVIMVVPLRHPTLEETMPVSPARNPWKPRKCKHCKLTYVPSCRDQGNARKSIFCTRKCKSSYHRSGGINFDQLIEKAARKVFALLREDDAFAQVIADKLRVTHFTVSPSRESSAAGS